MAEGSVDAGVPQQQSHHPAFLMVLVLVAGTSMMSAFLLLRSAFPPVNPHSAASPPVLALLAFGALCNVLCAVALYRRQRWGFYGLIVIAVGAAVVNLSGQGFAVGLFGLMLIPLVYLAMRMGGRGSAWATSRTATGSGRQWMARAGGLLLVMFGGGAAWFAFGANGSGGPVAINLDLPGSNTEIVVMHADGTGRRQLTRNNSASSSAIAWSPDGSKLLFSSNLSADQRTISRDLFVVNASGRGLRKLTSGSYNSASTWSPDGRQIAFVESDVLHVIDANGSNLGERAGYVDGDRMVGWAAAGDALYVTRGRQLHRIDLTSGDVQAIGSPDIEVERAVLSPDASSFAFTRTGNDRDDREVYVMRVDGSDVRQLTSNAESDTIAAWSPDGSKLLLSRGDAQDILEVVIIEIDGSGEQQLTNNDAVSTAAAFSPRRNAGALQRCRARRCRRRFGERKEAARGLRDER